MAEPMSNELRPCPFCGGDGMSDLVLDGAVIFCRSCCARGPAAYHGPPDRPPAAKRARAAWNRRSPDPVGELVEALKEVRIDLSILRGSISHASRRECRWEGMADEVGEWIGRIDAALAKHADADARADAFLSEVRAELIRARAKFPGDRIMTLALAEEFGEMCKAVLDEPAANVRKEAVQTAAMAARVVLDGDGSVNEWRAAKGLDPLVALPASGGEHG